MAPFVVGSQKEDARNTTPLEQRLGQATSVVMPLIELGLLGYVTWVLCYLICIQYLASPSDELQQTFNIQPRRSTGIALITVFALLLLALLISWMRLLQVIWSKVDILEPGAPGVEKKDVDSKHLEQYDAYVCDYEGVPLFCDKCRIYKPDRTHHCKELGRCIRRMDHYCPWAGGIIAETTHKFFLQGVVLGALVMAYVWLVVAIFLAERISKVSNWIAALAIGVLFSIFATTMACMTGYNLAINYTSVEAIQRGGITNIAFLIIRQPNEPTQLHTPPTSSKSEEDKATEADDEWPVLRFVERSGGRNFVVMQNKPFQHVWSTSMMRGWKDAMGESPLEWFLPLKNSPWKQKSRRGEFRWGEVVYDMAKKFEKDNPGARLAILE
ncbi:palmitoyltransferas-like protein pfa5 [Ophiobolus disseminans]|uniref:Palmitoyltransferase n=1 Tax=Ophiobolus disseminans TaxID=1469910 RepID=A0A6A6ZDU7_9PLEO|nr:palmitoyltransferas-like protein pfa5 [Ophiobolus disseminans]